VDHRTKQLLLLSTAVTTAAAAGNNSSSREGGQPTPPPLPTINNAVTDIHGYCLTLERLLHAERNELLLHFEKYSQYGAGLNIFWPPYQQQQQHHGSSSEQRRDPTVRARIFINGIADAKPALQVGDTVLVRPVERLSLPEPNGQVGLDGCPVWSHPHHTVEVKTTVQSVQRYVPGPHTVQNKGCDTVFMGWLREQETFMLQHSMKLFVKKRRKMRQSKGQPPKDVKFNVRFVPSQKHHARCLTALDWLRTTTCIKGQQQQQHAAQELLFPTTAPQVPAAAVANVKLDQSCDRLNKEQLTFVHMVVRRTLHPASDTVRGPMVLTGPAGTGTCFLVFCS
jgi:hypothetical protein